MCALQKLAVQSDDSVDHGAHAGFRSHGSGKEKTSFFSNRLEKKGAHYVVSFSDTKSGAEHPVQLTLDIRAEMHGIALRIVSLAGDDFFSIEMARSVMATTDGSADPFAATVMPLTIDVTASEFCGRSERLGGVIYRELGYDNAGLVVLGAPASILREEMKTIAARFSDGVRRAINNLEPARVGWGAADEPRQVTNRRRFAKPGMAMPNPFGGQDQVKGCSVQRDLVKPAGPVDPEIVFLSIQAADGRPIALLANYSMHYVGEVPAQDISADYFGAFADRIRQLLGAERLDPPFVGILSNGTSGDVDNTYSEPPGQLPPYARLRHVAGDVAQGVFAQCRKLQYHDWVPVGMVQRELELAVRKPTARQLLHAREMLADPQRPDKFPHERTYAQRIMRQQEAPATIRVIVQVLRIGDLGIAASPFETFAETGLKIKTRSPLKPTCTIELANGCYGYLPTPEQHQLGGYETWLGTNKVEIEASTRLAAALLEMLAELARAK